MKRFLALFCALFLSGSIFAQEIDEGDVPSENHQINLNETGDQYVKLGLMVTMPLNFGGSFPLYRDGKLSTGGAGMIGYHRFLTPNIAAGFDVAFGYNPTIGGNIFTYIPFIFSATYQPVYKQFEFPVTVGLGFATESYLSHSYFPGFIFKPQAGVFYRATPSWSFGLEGEFMYMPQWYSDSSKNDYGIFGSIVLSARYHF